MGWAWRDPESGGVFQNAVRDGPESSPSSELVPRLPEIR